jgi:3-oxoacyl-[acyl-carrier protein] reductase
MKTVLITGSSRGLGQALSDIFLYHGHNVIGHSRSNGDLLEYVTLSKLAQKAIKNDIDVLINNAGIYYDLNLTEMHDTEIDELIKVNLIAPILLSKYIIPIFHKKNSGLIININSMAGKSGNAGESIYSASKFGLRGFSQSLRREVSKYGIHVISVFVGCMQTDMAKHKPDYDKFILPSEVAKTIYAISENYKSMSVNEIDITRTNY